MHDIRRNLLYQVKKQSLKRSDPFHNPNNEDDDIRIQNQKLRARIRSQDTQIIRLNSKIEELNLKIMIASLKVDSTENGDKQNSLKNTINQFSSMPMLIQNKDLKQNNQILHQENLALNGKNNTLQAELRQLKSDKYSLQLKIKQFNILEKMREERFRDEVDRLTPIIVEEPGEYSVLVEAVAYMTKLLRQRIVEVVQNIFIKSVKQCEGNKKLNSFTVFNNYWKEVKALAGYGYLAVVGCYASIAKVMKIVDQRYADIDNDDQSGSISGTVDEWIVNNITEIKAAGTLSTSLGNMEEQRKLFRLMALKYRSKFPIKGEKLTVGQKIQNYLQHNICQEIVSLLKIKAQFFKPRIDDNSQQSNIYSQK